jgi:hypothetical protein
MECVFCGEMGVFLGGDELRSFLFGAAARGEVLLPRCARGGVGEWWASGGVWVQSPRSRRGSFGVVGDGGCCRLRGHGAKMQKARGLGPGPLWKMSRGLCDVRAF